MEAWDCPTPGPGALLCEQRPTLCGALEDVQLGRAQCLRDWTFRPFVEDGIHTRPLWVTAKAGALRGFLAARGLLNGRGLRVARGAAEGRACMTSVSAGRGESWTSWSARALPAGWELRGASGAPCPCLPAQLRGPPLSHAARCAPLPACRHRVANQQSLCWRPASEREAPPTTARDAEHRGFHLCARPTGSDTRDTQR